MRKEDPCEIQVANLQMQGRLDLWWKWRLRNFRGCNCCHPDSGGAPGKIKNRETPNPKQTSFLRLCSHTSAAALWAPAGCVTRPRGPGVPVRWRWNLSSQGGFETRPLPETSGDCGVRSPKVVSPCRASERHLLGQPAPSLQAAVSGLPGTRHGYPGQRGWGCGSSHELWNSSSCLASGGEEPSFILGLSCSLFSPPEEMTSETVTSSLL